MPILLLSLALLAGLIASPALAHHRKTDPVVRYTSGGDNALSRLPGSGRTAITFALPSGADTTIVSLKPFRKLAAPLTIVSTGDNRNPAISFSGDVVAFDTDADPMASGNPGRQIVMSKRGALFQGADDPSGTSENPSLDVGGVRVAFESTGDLAGVPNQGTRQVFLRHPTGQIAQVSRGLGSSRNAVLSSRKHLLAFQSTSDPVTGLDTGIDQIWLGTYDLVGHPAPLTDGLAPSTNPVFSDDGALLGFQSRADLAGTGADLGVPQIFVYHVKTATWAQITNEPTGCTDPAIGTFKRDWRVTYVCDGVGYIYLLRDDQRLRVQTAGGHTTRVVPALGQHFLLVATTADLVAGGLTAGHEIYQVNLFKRPAEALPPGFKAVWFPARGVPPPR